MVKKALGLLDGFTQGNFKPRASSDQGAIEIKQYAIGPATLREVDEPASAQAVQQGRALEGLIGNGASAPIVPNGRILVPVSRGQIFV